MPKLQTDGISMEQIDLFSLAKPNRPDQQRESRQKNAGPCEWKIIAVRECAPATTTPIIDQPKLAVEYWHSHVATAPHYNPDVECFVVIILTARLRVRGHYVVSIGSLNETIAHPREVFRAAVIAAAYGVVLIIITHPAIPHPPKLIHEPRGHLWNPGRFCELR